MNFPSCITSIASGCWRKSGHAIGLGLLLAAAIAGPAQAQAAPTTALLTFSSFTNFTRTTRPDETVLLSPELAADLAWDELIVSWNASMATNGSLVCEARALATDGPTRWFTLGHWSSGATPGARTSVNDQRDDTARVETDTLILKQPAPRVQVRVTLHGTDTRLKFLALCLADVHRPPAAKPPRKAAWGRSIAVPVRSQADYPEGVSKWCSPTSTTMLLAHWAGELHRPELDFDVRTTAAGVFDLAWDGTGNWPFNMAFAGAQPGLRACVARLEDVADLEEWISQGLPVAVSLSYTMLLGSPVPRPENGHLVVVCGFTATGDVVVNDPGVRRERVRRTFPRADFARAWAHSQRTVYLVWPEDRTVPWPVGPRP
jgi:hypothetical protein